MSQEDGVKDGVRTLHARSRDEWRNWLEDNGQTEKAVWAIIYQQRSRVPSVRFHDAIVDALCYGWVDSRAAPRDEESCYLLFSPRNPKSTWGRTNRARAEEMIRQGLMRPPGLAVIELARRTGTWDALKDAQDGVIPDDLQALFDANEVAYLNFQAFPPSSRRVILEWIATAKRPDTRQRRVIETVRMAAENLRANHPRQGR
jgi:uncharacterized protein YdeI (YjbR/CyaY-like superfamily)